MIEWGFCEDWLSGVGQISQYRTDAGLLFLIDRDGAVEFPIRSYRRMPFSPIVRRGYMQDGPIRINFDLSSLVSLDRVEFSSTVQLIVQASESLSDRINIVKTYTTLYDTLLFAISNCVSAVSRKNNYSELRRQSQSMIDELNLNIAKTLSSTTPYRMKSTLYTFSATDIETDERIGQRGSEVLKEAESAEIFEVARRAREARQQAEQQDAKHVAVVEAIVMASKLDTEIKRAEAELLIKEKNLALFEKWGGLSPQEDARHKEALAERDKAAGELSAYRRLAGRPGLIEERSHSTNVVEVPGLFNNPTDKPN